MSGYSLEYLAKDTADGGLSQWAQDEIHDLVWAEFNDFRNIGARLIWAHKVGKDLDLPTLTDQALSLGVSQGDIDTLIKRTPKAKSWREAALRVATICTEEYQWDLFTKQYPGTWDVHKRLRIDTVTLSVSFDANGIVCASVWSNKDDPAFDSEDFYNQDCVPDFLDRACNAMAAAIIKGVSIDPKAIPSWLTMDDRLLNAINAQINQLIITSRLYRCEQ